MEMRKSNKKVEIYRMCEVCGWKSSEPMKLEITGFKGFCPNCFRKSQEQKRENDKTLLKYIETKRIPFLIDNCLNYWG